MPIDISSCVAGTRRSMLAKTQTAQVIRLLAQALPNTQWMTKEIVTQGDRILDVPLSQVGGKGLFISEIEDALLAHEVDFAVHSMKDVPAELAPLLVIGCIPHREDSRDLLITSDGRGLDDIAEGSRIGTSSLRRAAQLKALRPDLRIEALRGNIDSRLRRLSNMDGIVLAAAGLRRMGWWSGDAITGSDVSAFGVALDSGQMLPAVGQGALALECLATRDDLLAAFTVLHDLDTARCVGAERAFLEAVGGSCQVPVAAHAVLRKQVEMQVIELTGFIGLPDGSQVVRGTVVGTNAQELGRALGRELLARGGQEILSQLATDLHG